MNLNGDTGGPVVREAPHPPPRRGLLQVVRGRLPGFDRPEPELAVPGIARVVLDAFNTTQDRISRARLERDPPDVAIGPDLGAFGLFDFHRAAEGIALGHRAARAALPGSALCWKVPRLGREAVGTRSSPPACPPVIRLSRPPAMGALHTGGLPMYTSRRQILLSGGASLVGLASGLGRPGLSRAADRPVLTHGLQSGDVGTDSAVVWARSDRPARAIVEWATTESFSDIRGGVFADALPETDGTVKVALTGLPAARTCSTGSASRTSPPRRSSDRLRSAGSVPRRRTGARCRSAGRATRRARAGASTRPAAA